MLVGRSISELRKFNKRRCVDIHTRKALRHMNFKNIYFLSQAVVAYTFNPSTEETGRRKCL